MRSEDKVFVLIVFGVLIMFISLALSSGTNDKERYKEYNVCLKNKQPKDVCRLILSH